MITLTEQQRLQIAREEATALLDADKALSRYYSSSEIYTLIARASSGIKAAASSIEERAETPEDAQHAGGIVAMSELIASQIENLYRKADITDRLVGGTIMITFQSTTDGNNDNVTGKGLLLGLEAHIHDGGHLDLLSDTIRSIKTVGLIIGTESFPQLSSEQIRELGLAVEPLAQSLEPILEELHTLMPDVERYINLAIDAEKKLDKEVQS